MSDDQMRVDGHGNPVDWEHEALRQDRLRGVAVTKLAKIQQLLQDHQHCETLCDVIIDVQDVLDD